MIYRLTWWLARFLFRLVLPRTVVGAENVPRSGPVILASNHISNLDPLAVPTSVWRPSVTMAKEELFGSRAFAWYIRRLGAFPVRRGAADRGALKHALEALEQGKMLLIFPEGTRSETGELQEPEMGVGMIAYRSGAPVVPVYVWGTNEAMPKGGGLRLTRTGVAFGKPMRFAPEAGKAGREEYEAAAKAIMNAIRALRDAQQARRST